MEIALEAATLAGLSVNSSTVFAFQKRDNFAIADIKKG